MGRVTELVSPGRFDVKDAAEAVPGRGAVLVSVRACGICGSDVQRFKGKQRQRYPIILGHEISGVVSAVGADVDRVHAGDPVVIIPLVPCFSCPYCLDGEYALCAQYGFIGSRQPGGFASSVLVPEQNVFPLTERIELQTAVLLEPLAVGSHALRRVRFTSHDTVTILGAGSVGLCAALVARHLGSSQIHVGDVSPDRVEHAKRLGFEAKHLQPGDEAFSPTDVVVEAAGSPAAFRHALGIAKPKGRIACVGTMAADLSLPAEAWEQVLRKELTVVGVWNAYSAPFPGDDWSTALSVIAMGATQVRELITHRFKLEDVQQCFELLLANPGKYGKVLLCP